MVEVFKTNIIRKGDADKMVQHLKQYLPAAKINFDLDDCDNILRIEYPLVSVVEVTKILTAQGFYCEVLK